MFRSTVVIVYKTFVLGPYGLDIAVVSTASLSTPCTSTCLQFLQYTLSTRAVVFRFLVAYEAFPSVLSFLGLPVTVVGRVNSLSLGLLV